MPRTALRRPSSYIVSMPPRIASSRRSPRVRVLHHEAAQRVGHRQHLHDADAARVAGLRALRAALRVVERDLRRALANRASPICSTISGSADVRLLAVLAQRAHEPLREDADRRSTSAGSPRRPCRAAGSPSTAASLVCTVDSTRWPVSADCTAISAVSRSRISPIMITSGSCRTIERSALAKVRLICGFTWIWLIPGIWYSTGSSTVRILTSGLFSGRAPCRAWSSCPSRSDR